LDEYIGDVVLIGGNLNCPAVIELTIDAHLTDVLQQYNMTQHVKVATHLMGNILDLIMTSAGHLQVSNACDVTC